MSPFGAPLLTAIEDKPRKGKVQHIDNEEDVLGFLRQYGLEVGPELLEWEE